MKWQDVINLISNKKNEIILFKNKVTSFSEIGRNIVSFANIEQGHIIIGLDIENIHITGSNQTKEWIEKEIEKSITPALTYKIYEINKDQKIITIIKIKKQTNKPVYYNNICYIYDEENKNITLANLENKIKENLKSETNDKLNQKKLHNEINKRQNEALKFLKKKLEIKNKIYRNICHVSHKTAHIELIDLVSKGYIEQKGAGRSTKYILKDLTKSI